MKCSLNAVALLLLMLSLSYCRCESHSAMETLTVDNLVAQTSIKDNGLTASKIVTSNSSQVLTSLPDVTCLAGSAITAATGTGFTCGAVSGGWSNAVVFGTGPDGALTFDGTTTVKGIVPVSNVYTLTRDIAPTDMTVNVGVTIKTNNYALIGSGTLTDNGNINNDGADAFGCGANNNGSTGAITPQARFIATIVGGSGGSAGTLSGNLPVGYFTPASGGAGGTSPSGAGQAGGANTCTGGGGGGSSNGAGGGGGASQNNYTPLMVTGPQEMLYGGALGYNSRILLSAGASGGAGQTCAFCGAGAGGNGGGYLYVAFPTITGTGVIHSRGGAGCGGNGIGGGGGGGGGGGIVDIIYGHRSGSLTIDANGGTHGTGGSAPGGDGGSCIVILDNVSKDGS